ncbi:hypothetical protein F4776DRAFT_524448 [Hypoxylon sp. NC0597]|nr:hypothetical protein F4776DRAFT_524448 [Hypoxylon sp. NC0597]
MASSSGPQGNRHPSWATVVSNQSPDGKDGNVAAPTSTKPGKVSFKPKGGKNWTNHKNGQRSQQLRSSHPSNSTRPPAPTFRDQYLQQVQAAEQSASHTPEPISQPAVLTQDAQSTTRLNTEIASLKATVATLNDDLSRRSSDLIQAKTDLAIKDSEIESLQNTIAMLNQKVDSTAAADKANHAKFTAKDNMIKKLQYENASLRDAIHTGVVSIAQIYGPGSTQAFTKIASKEADMIEQAAKGYTDGHRNVQQTQHSPNNSSQVSKQNGAPPHGQPIRNGRVDNASKKAQKPFQHVGEVAIPTLKEGDRPTNVVTPVTVDHPVEKVNLPGKETHSTIEKIHTPTKDNPTAERVHSSVQANNSSSEQNAATNPDVDTTPNSHDTPAVKSSNLAVGEGVQVDGSPLSEARAPSIMKTQDADVIDTDGKNNSPSPSSPQVNDDISTVQGNVSPTSGKYAFKGQESTDLTHGVTGTNAHANNAKPISSLSQVEDGTMGSDTPSSYQGTRLNCEIGDSQTVAKTIAAAASATDKPRLVSFLPVTSIFLFRPAIAEPTSEVSSSVPAAEQADGNNNRPTENNDGWVNVQGKNRHKNKAKGKAKQKVDVAENQSPEPKANDNLPKATKPALKEKVVPAKAPKRWIQKPNGTVIGSNSVFSQAAKKQRNENGTGKEKEETRKASDGSSSNGKNQEKNGSPPRNGSSGRGSPARSTNGGKKSEVEKPKVAGSKTDGKSPTGLSWADEVEEADAKLQQTFQ